MTFGFILKLQIKNFVKMNYNKTYHVLVADDHEIFRKGLCELLNSEKDFDVIGEAGNGREVITFAYELSPDIVLMDITMPLLNGVDATRLILEQNSNIKIIALSMHSDKSMVESMLKAGSSGYVLKDCLFEELVLALRKVVSGEIFLSSKIGNVDKDIFFKMRKKGIEYNPPILTLREREVLQNIAEGHSLKEISELLKISIKTVEAHSASIKKKLNIYDVANLTKYAIQQKMISI
jgi:DNA-binding NarL/FixJ family response regulator